MMCLRGSWPVISVMSLPVFSRLNAVYLSRLYVGPRYPDESSVNSMISTLHFLSDLPLLIYKPNIYFVFLPTAGAGKDWKLMVHAR